MKVRGVLAPGDYDLTIDSVRNRSDTVTQRVIILLVSRGTTFNPESHKIVNLRVRGAHWTLSLVE